MSGSLQLAVVAVLAALAGVVVLRRRFLASPLAVAGIGEMAEHIVDSMSDGLAVFDDCGKLVGWNPAAAELTGWSHAEAEHRIPVSTPDGLVPLGAGRWVRTQSFTLRRFAGC